MLTLFFIDSGIIGLFVVAIIIMGFGSGWFKSNVAPLIAEQVTRQKAVVEVRKGKKVLYVWRIAVHEAITDTLHCSIDPALTSARLFMYFCMFTRNQASSYALTIYSPSRLVH